jgi:2-methylisocitrate lyase-like PEP mutase family enzyme
MPDLRTHAAHLRSFHRRGDPLVLPNAWDAASAQAVERAGFAAVATTSSGVAASLGWADGEQTPPDEMFWAIARIARAVTLPVTADVEGGYGLEPEEVAQRLIDAGAAGCNLEDSDHRAGGGLLDPALQAARIARLKRAAEASGADLVVNARIDVFFRGEGERADRLEEAVRRAALYVEAGADCVFPILAKGEALIAALLATIPGPVNILALAAGPSVTRMAALGAARVSFGGRLAQLSRVDHERRLAAIRGGEPV